MSVALKRLLMLLLIPYVAFVLILAVLQRRLMYPAARAAGICVSDFPHLTEWFQAASDVAVTTTDGAVIRGWHLRYGAENADFLILLFHGNAGHRGMRTRWYWIAKTLRVDVLAIDYHGYGDSEGHPSERTLRMDAEAAWNFAVETLQYPTQALVILGESLGGGVGVQLAADKCREGTPPAGLILVATFNSMVDVADNRFPWMPVRRVLSDHYRSDLKIPDVTCPVLQFHGADDTIVPLALAKRLYECTPQRSADGRPPVFVEFPGTGHNDILYFHEHRVTEQIGMILKRAERP